MPEKTNLLSKPDTPIAYNHILLHDAPPKSETSDHAQSPILIIFINGLMLPMTAWEATINLLKSQLLPNPTSHNEGDLPQILAITYDRYGQPESRPPSGSDPQKHDMLDVVSDLHALLLIWMEKHFSASLPPLLFFVSHSIGVPLTRLYDQKYPGTVSAHLFLDSNIANTDFVSLFPDPDGPSFDAKRDLPDDSTVQDLRDIRERTKKMFSPEISNSEGLDRRNSRSLLPLANGPMLAGPNGSPFLTVVGHDPVTFAEEGFRYMGAPRGLNFRFMQPAWEEYNRGLLGLSDEGKVKGVVIAEGAGHFVQRDTPGVVSREILEILWKMCKNV